jgi:hypothetical protein
VLCVCVCVRVCVCMHACHPCPVFLIQRANHFLLGNQRRASGRSPHRVMDAMDAVLSKFCPPNMVTIAASLPWQLLLALVYTHTHTHTHLQPRCGVPWLQGTASALQRNPFKPFPFSVLCCCCSIQGCPPIALLPLLCCSCCSLSHLSLALLHKLDQPASSAIECACL